MRCAPFADRSHSLRRSPQLILDVAFDEHAANLRRRSPCELCGGRYVRAQRCVIGPIDEEAAVTALVRSAFATLDATLMPLVACPAPRPITSQPINGARAPSPGPSGSKGETAFYDCLNCKRSVRRSVDLFAARLIIRTPRSRPIATHLTSRAASGSRAAGEPRSERLRQRAATTVTRLPSRREGAARAPMSLPTMATARTATPSAVRLQVQW